MSYFNPKIGDRVILTDIALKGTDYFNKKGTVLGVKKDWDGDILLTVKWDYCLASEKNTFFSSRFDLISNDPDKVCKKSKACS